jgi:ribose transport system permease protein
VILAGGIDLSVGSVLALSGIVAAYAMVERGMPAWAGCALGVAVGALAGLVNGLIVTRLRVPAFIATLGTLLIARGFALRIAKGVTIDGTPDAFNAIASARPLGLPAPLLLIAATAAVVALLLHYTKFGRYVYAIGSNAEAARVSGVGVEGVTLWVYVLGGASLAGGEGRVSGTILGALLIAVLRNGSNLLGVDPFDQNIYIGLLIIAAVAFDQRLRRLR